MAIVSGHGGAIALGTEGTDMDAFIRSWTLEDTAALHDVTTMGTTQVSREFLKGMEDWTLTAEFVADSAMNLGAHAPGDSATTVTLDAVGTTADEDQYIFDGIVQSVTFTRDVDGVARGTIRIKGNQSGGMTTRPDPPPPA